MNTLDAVRAARNLDNVKSNERFAVWGHSQGGHASLFTGQLAASYAPELDLVAVAAGAPPTDIVALFKVNIETTVDKILVSMALKSWEDVYSAADLSQVVTPEARSIVGRIAKNCLYNQSQILASVPAALALDLLFISTPPWEVEPWKGILDQISPGRTAVDVPILVTQGDADPIIAPEVTTQFVTTLCAAGESVDYRVYPGVGHLDAGHLAADDVVQWLAARFAGEPSQSTCR